MPNRSLKASPNGPFCPVGAGRAGGSWGRERPHFEREASPRAGAGPARREELRPGLAAVGVRDGGNSLVCVSGKAVKHSRKSKTDTITISYLI